jgi:hypothetical protein
MYRPLRFRPYISRADRHWMELHPGMPLHRRPR